MTDRFITHDLAEMIGGQDKAKMYLVIDTKDEGVEVVVEKTYRKYYKLSDLKQAEQDYEALNGSGYIVDIERLVKMRHLKAGLEDHK